MVPGRIAIEQQSISQDYDECYIFCRVWCVEKILRSKLIVCYLFLQLDLLQACIT